MSNGKSEGVYVLINTEPIYKDEIIKKLKEIKGVKSVETAKSHNLYDIIVKAESDDRYKLRELVNSKIRKIGRISASLVLLKSCDYV